MAFPPCSVVVLGERWGFYRELRVTFANTARRKRVSPQRAASSAVREIYRPVGTPIFHLLRSS